MKNIFSSFVLLLLILPAFAKASDDPAPKKKTEAPKVDLSSLSTDEIEIYQYGKISTGSLIGGGLLGTFIGLGTGHIVEGQYGNKGWIFTVGELGSLGIISIGAANVAVDCTFNAAFNGTGNCSSGDGLLIAGAVLYIGFRVWELVDVWTLPGRYNDRYDAIKAKVEGLPEKRADMILAPMILASNRDNKTPVGLQLLWRF